MEAAAFTMADDLAAMHRFVRVERSIDVSVRIDLAPPPDSSETIAAPWKKPRRACITAPALRVRVTSERLRTSGSVVRDCCDHAHERTPVHLRQA